MSDILLTPNYAGRVAGSVPKRLLGVERNLALDLVKRYDDVYSIVNFIESSAICQGVEAEGKIIIQVKHINYGNLQGMCTKSSKYLKRKTSLSFLHQVPKFCTLMTRVVFRLSVSSIFINRYVHVCFDSTETSHSKVTSINQLTSEAIEEKETFQVKGEIIGITTHTVSQNEEYEKRDRI